MSNVVENIKNIEKSVYPHFMLQYEDSITLEDVFNAANKGKEQGNFFYYACNDWYLIGINTKDKILISDLASLKSLSFSEMNFIIENISKLGNKKIIADCRDLTSYRLLKILNERGTIKIVNEDPWIWGNEKMYKVTFLIETRMKFQEWIKQI